uniref:Uncharacterized protein n=1 Tax=Cucumis sativus TaxID=3659 RepID=A0A0A0KSG1_CUCSA
MAMCWIRQVESSGQKCPIEFSSRFLAKSGPIGRIRGAKLKISASRNFSVSLSPIHAQTNFSVLVMGTDSANLMSSLFSKKTCWMDSSTLIKIQLKPFLPSESISFCSIKFGMLNSIANNAAAAGQKATRGIFIFAATSKAHPRFQAIWK